MNNITVIGAGSWGTALACLLVGNGYNVTLWCYNKKEEETINKEKENKMYLPGIVIPEKLKVTNEIEYCTKNVDIYVLAVPSKFVRSSLKMFKPYMESIIKIINVAKGIEEGTLLVLSEVIKDELPNSKIAILSGPSHAEEVAKKIVTTCVVASKDSEFSEEVQNIFMNDYFRVYTNDDLIGVELGGALKNVIALSAGISDGLGFGDNTKAALMTRGLAEIARLGVAMGARNITFKGLSGMGDLIVTCTSMHSRNRRAGILIGEGVKLEEVLKKINMVVEGVNTAKAAYKLGEKYKVDMPIIKQVNKVLFENKNPKEAVMDLMARSKTSEYENL